MLWKRAYIQFIIVFIPNLYMTFSSLLCVFFSCWDVLAYSGATCCPKKNKNTVDRLSSCDNMANMLTFNAGELMFVMVQLY